MPEEYRENVIEYEPKGKKWIILTQASNKWMKEQRLDGGWYRNMLKV